MEKIDEKLSENFKIRKYKKVTEEEMLEEERDLDQYSLEHKIQVKDKVIKTFGELRPYIKSTKIARKFEHVLTDSEFSYFFNWILHKELKENKFDFNSK